MHALASASFVLDFCLSTLLIFVTYNWLIIFIRYIRGVVSELGSKEGQGMEEPLARMINLVCK